MTDELKQIIVEITTRKIQKYKIKVCTGNNTNTKYSVHFNLFKNIKN